MDCGLANSCPTGAMIAHRQVSLVLQLHKAKRPFYQRRTLRQYCIPAGIPVGPLEELAMAEADGESSLDVKMSLFTEHAVRNHG